MKLKDRLKQDNYLDFLGLLAGIIVGIIVVIKVNVILGIFSFIVVTILVAQIIRQIIVAYITNVNYKLISKDVELNSDIVKEMSKELHDIIELENELNVFLDNNSSKKKTDYSEKELNKRWEEKQNYFFEKANDIFSRMNNLDLLLAIGSTKSITQIVDIFKYFKPLTPDINFMKEHPNELIPYYLQILSDEETFKKFSINGYYYYEMNDKAKFEEIEKFVLENMSNEEIMILANASHSWLNKLYYYGYLKKDKNKEND